MTTSWDGLDIVILIPCYNEEASIGKVVRDLRAVLPDARIFVGDNNSQDQTVALAQAAGAVVLRETQQGKGNVIRRLFADVDADIYLMIDGDDTYDPQSAPKLIDCLLAGPYDMVNARRIGGATAAYRLGHRSGNQVLTALVGFFFGRRYEDVLSGYRALSRRFVKSFPVLSKGFEIETELTIHALELQMPVAEIETPYKERPEGSTSKLNTYRDGLNILRTILVLVKEERPLQFFSIASLFLAGLSVALAWPIFTTFMETGLVPRFPTAILSTGLMLLSFLGLGCGLILDTVTRGRKEMKRMRYLEIEAPWRPNRPSQAASSTEQSGHSRRVGAGVQS